MTLHLTELATAVGCFPYGSPVLIRNGRASAAAIAKANGVAKRPHRAGNRTHAADGEQLHVCTVGGLLAEVDGYALWVTIADGRVDAGAQQ